MNQQDYHRQRTANASTVRHQEESGHEEALENGSSSQLRTQAQIHQSNAHASSLQPCNSTVGVIMAKSTVLLATAIITISAPNGNSIRVRALLDNGADASFISQAVVQILGLRPRQADVAVLGFSSSVPLQIRHQVDLQIRNVSGNFSMEITALVRPKLNFIVPSTEISAHSWSHIQGFQLADPEFATPSQIELLLGAVLWNKLYLDQRIKGPSGTPDAYLTVFGHVLLGPAGPEARPSTANSAHTLSSTNF